MAHSRAAVPEAIRVWASDTRPVPPTSSSAPVWTACRHWRSVMRSPPRSPRRTAQANSTVPAMVNRTAIMLNGGMVSMATLMARNVEPQIT